MAFASGDRIGAYEILTPLGAGGMGEVYRARDTRLGRLVAIKFVSADLLKTDPTARERLDREARLASSLNHPGIVTVYDVGEFDEHPYIVMELIEGQSLYARLLSGPMKPRDAIDVATQVADALAAAHTVGVMHRDLKPQNIMLTADGRAKIVDFGLSKLTLSAAGAEEETVGRSALTSAHTIIGSAGYMAPEQILGELIDHRADQFSLGVILYELLARQRAFKRATAMQTMAAVLDHEPPKLSEIRPELSPQVVAIVERCLAKERSNRYASTVDLARDLREARETATSPTRPLARVRPRRGTAWLAAGAVFALVAVAAVASWLRHPVAPASPTVRQVVVLPFANVTRDPADQVFLDGLVETLTSSLGQLERFQRTLRVVPASEVRREAVTGIKDARQAFGATIAITGSLQRGPSSVRITLNLVDAIDVRQLASRTLDVGTGQQVSTQDGAAVVLATLLDLQLAPEARSALTAGGTATSIAYEEYVQGRGYLQRFDKAENLDRAVDLFSRATSADPQYALAHAALGEAYWRKYELDHQAPWIDRAVASCATALKIDAQLAPVHVTLALIARGRGRYEEAIDQAQLALAIDPVSSDAYRELGRAYEALNRFDEAEATYKKADQARPNDWLTLNTLGGFYLTRNRAAQAEATFRRVVALTPDNTRANNNLGAAIFKLGREDEAAATWEHSVAIRPTSGAVSNLGTYYYKRGRYADAARAFERATTFSPTDYRLWRNLGAALYWAPGERPRSAAAYDQAVQLAEQAVKVNPRQADLLANLADAYSMLGRVGDARRTVDALERLDPKDAGVLFTLAGAYEQLGDRGTALTTLARARAAGASMDEIARSPGLAQLRKDQRYVRLIH
jgi:serine/threonine-protein kinase